MTIVLTVVGVPQPQGNKRGFKTPSGRVVIVEGKTPEARARFHSWRQAIAEAAIDWHNDHDGRVLDEPLRVACEFRLPRPKSIPKKRVHPTTRPDCDKLLRAVGDALTRVVWRDDALIITMSATKRYAAADEPPGCTITIEALT